MPRASVTIGDVTVAPGTNATALLPVPDTFLRQGSVMPVHVFHGRREGPSLFVCAAIHGDELNGVEIIRRLLRMKRLGRLAGTLYAIPIVNIYGFMANTRYLPDRRDLNRFFPGREGGSLASELAAVFFENVVRKCGYGIDLHTGSNHRRNLPHVRGDMEDPAVLAMAEAFGAPLALDLSGMEGSLRAAARESGVRVLLYEAGEPLRFDEFAIRAGLRGITSVLEALGMLPAGKRKRERTPLQIATDRTWCRAPASGLFRASVKLGRHVRKGEVLGSIHDPFDGKSTDLTAPQDGVIIGDQSLASVYKGDAIMHIARFDAPRQAQASMDEYSEMLMDARMAR
ncbi:succinylglutamate desuccinylase/aspartoacylase family protein [Desulfovibrio sp. Huiquan2017]|uniref:succinylglutamate desuccinylase/aspartoacylase family protein n=1 Tax=Desulfovibrio sp. Huiquan2017 TaxID=2816861 RepID=UPI001A92FC69|nr:succinylglutamate desuccinylase/aspartoacylase family protein [Desulfovibrio sp. Huiquan2017]